MHLRSPVRGGGVGRVDVHEAATEEGKEGEEHRVLLAVS